MTKTPIQDGSRPKNRLGLGPVLRSKLRERAEELAIINGSWLPCVTASDFAEARLELTVEADRAPQPAIPRSLFESEGFYVAKH